MTERSEAASEERLYGLPGAERLFLNLAEAYESDIEPYLDEDDRTPRVIEEWSVAPADATVPSAHWIAEYVVERAAEDLGADDGLEGIDRLPSVLEAAEALRAAVAARITWRMADRRLAEHTITWDGDEPLVDGERMYRLRPTSQP